MKITGIDPVAVTELSTYKPFVPEEQQNEFGANKKTDTEQQKQLEENCYSKKELVQSLETLNNTMKDYQTELRFEIHEKSGEIMVKVLNSEDGSVIREIPPEKVLEMVGYFKEILGIMVDKLI